MSERPSIALSMYPGLEPHALRPEHIDALAGIGDLLDAAAIEGMAPERADEVLAAADVLLGHWGCSRLDKAFLDRAPRLGMFAYAAGTMRGVVTPATFARVPRITSGAAANAVPVAEFTVAAIVWANKGAFVERERLRGVEVPPVGRRHPVGNWGKRVGLVGASHVGRAVVSLLRPYRCEVVVADPYLADDEAERLGVRRVDLDSLLATSDVVSLHAPALPATERMIGAPELGRMMNGATLINTARGVLVDHEALTAELRTGRLSAVLDVTDPEPLPAGHPLLALANCVVTPHLAGSQGTELGRLADLVIEEIRRFAAGQPPLHPVGADDMERVA
ncbi:MAG TPA: hydroxyacid dehydrogenase [Acidimicrobiales bacterium]|nr:hydroxyacid dehydrogenase [Acidimicrobiales bacterium]